MCYIPRMTIKRLILSVTLLAASSVTVADYPRMPCGAGGWELTIPDVLFRTKNGRVDYDPIADNPEYREWVLITDAVLKTRKFRCYQRNPYTYIFGNLVAFGKHSDVAIKNNGKIKVCSVDFINHLNHVIDNFRTGDGQYLAEKWECR